MESEGMKFLHTKVKCSVIPKINKWHILGLCLKAKVVHGWLAKESLQTHYFKSAVQITQLVS